MRLVILPGLDGDANLRQPVKDMLDRHLETQVIDYPKALFRYDDMLAEVAPHLPKDDFILIAESYGGPLAIRLTAEHPAHLRGLVFIASFARPPRFVPRPVLWLLGRLPVQSTLGQRLVFRISGRGHLTRAMITRFVTVAKALPATTIRGRLREVLTTDLRANLAQITVPMICLQPDEDILVSRRSGRDFVAAGAGLIKVAGSHFLLEEDPEAAARHLLSAIELIQREGVDLPRDGRANLAT